MNHTSYEKRIKDYWKERSVSFEKTRESELNDIETGNLWMQFFKKYFPSEITVSDILDAGTGAGYFAILLASHGYHTIGIDLTPEMIDAAKNLAEKYHSSAEFQIMNASKLDFPDESFDVVVTRNLTWTIPDVQSAYREWFRVLRPGGVLINFDANYGENVKYELINPPVPSQDTPFGHQPLPQNMLEENRAITLSMEASRQTRPLWDFSLLASCGYTEFGADLHAGRKILGQWDQRTSPMFVVWAKKQYYL